MQVLNPASPSAFERRIMKIFNGVDKEVIVLLTKEEAKAMMDILECAVENRPRKKTWKSILHKWESEVYVY